MLDTGKRDHKILAVAVDDPEFNGFKEASQLPVHRLRLLRRFFQDYKTLEGKLVEVDDFQPAAQAFPSSRKRWTVTARCADAVSRNTTTTLKEVPPWSMAWN